MGTSFLSLHTPNRSGLRCYRISLKVLASAYFSMSALSIFALVFQVADNSTEHFSVLNIFISSTQAILFAFTIITLLNPSFVSRKKLLPHLLPYGIFLVTYLISQISFGDPSIVSLSDLEVYLTHPTMWVRILFLGYYMFQLIYYTYLFLREVKRYDQDLLDYFSEIYQLRLKWVRVAFFSALTIGVIALIANFIPTQYDWITNVAFALFYFGFAQEYIKYNKIFNIIEPAITSATENFHIPSKALIKTDWNQYKQKIAAGKYYLEPGVNIEDVARKLNIGRTTLSNLINREEGVNFNTWINHLRIEDAKQLLTENPDYTIAAISEMVG